MAVYLVYEQTSQDAAYVGYAIQTMPNDPQPARVRIPTADGAAPPVVTGAKAAANKAIRHILQRKSTQGTWPRTGAIMS